jgi:alkyl sulfatase BDS1-like metallo-beta-lactamase superfamily hydrolase
VAGIRFRLIFAPGETNDQIVVWLPDQKVLIPGDNFYWTFPNLYTIRGTMFRSLKNWYQSIDKMRDLGAETMIPCHTLPITGRERIEKILTDYRDAIQYTHDQAVRGMNLGMTPDELAENVELPPHLAKAPYLQPFYGKVSWSVRSMFAGNLGWFDGDSATLQPLTRREEAKLMAEMAGGEDRLLKLANQKLENKEYQAALQLTGYLIQLDPENQAARDTRVQSLLALGEREPNPNARHYYLSEAVEIRDGFVVGETSEATPSMLRAFSLQSFLESMAVALDPVASGDVNKCVGMFFPDADEAFTIHVRHGVAEVRKRPREVFNQTDMDIRVVADGQVFKEMLARLRNPVTTLPGFTYEKGNTVAMVRFLAMFKPGEPKLPCEPLREPAKS